MKKILTCSLTIAVLCSYAQGPGSGGSTNGNLQWRTSGNNASTSDFIGTTNQQSLLFKANNSLVLEMTPNGELFMSKLTSVNDGILRVGGSGKVERIDFTNNFSHVLNGQGIFTDISTFTGLKLSGNDIVQTSSGNVSLTGTLKLANNLYLPTLANGKDQDLYLDAQGNLKVKNPALLTSCILGAPYWSIGGDSLTGVTNGGDLALGTCDGVDLVFKAGGPKRMWLEHVTGNISIANSIPVNSNNVQKLNVAGNIFAQGPNGFAASGDKAYLYLGDQSHYISSIYGSAIEIGTNGLPVHIDNGDLLVKGYGNFGAGNQATVLLGNAANYIYAKNGTGVSIGTTYYGDFLNIKENGNVVIKQGNGNINLALGSAYGAALDYGTSFLGFNLERSNAASGTWTKKTDGANNGGALIWGGVQGSIFFSPIPNTNGGSTDDANVSDATVNGNKTMEILWNNNLSNPFKGQVIIGKEYTGSTHSDFRLSVSGKIVAQSVYLTMTDWPDYVFEKDYKLKTLEEVKAYIEKNNHLPGVPTTKEVLENGNNVGETNKILLEKVEELTLYLIQINEEVKGLKKENESLKKSLYK